MRYFYYICTMIHEILTLYYTCVLKNIPKVINFLLFFPLPCKPYLYLWFEENINKYYLCLQKKKKM